MVRENVLYVKGEDDFRVRPMPLAEAIPPKTRKEYYDLISDQLDKDVLDYDAVGDTVEEMFRQGHEPPILQHLLNAQMEQDWAGLKRAVHHLRAVWPSIPVERNWESQEWLEWENKLG